MAIRLLTAGQELTGRKLGLRNGSHLSVKWINFRVVRHLATIGKGHKELHIPVVHPSAGPPFGWLRETEAPLERVRQSGFRVYNLMYNLAPTFGGSRVRS